MQRLRPSHVGRITLATAVNIAIRLAMAVAGVVVVATLARSLGPHDYGFFGVSLVLMGAFVSVLELGLTGVAAREVASEPAQRPQFAAALVVVRVPVAALAVLVALAIMPLVASSPDERRAYLMLALVIPLAVTSGLGSIALGRLRPVQSVAAAAAQTVVWTGATVLVAVTGGGLLRFATVFVAAFTASSVVSVALAWRLTRLDFRGATRLARSIMRDSWPLSTSHVLFLVYRSADVLLVTMLAGATQAAYYVGSYRFLEVVQTAAVTLAGMLLPLLATLRRQAAATDRLEQIGTGALRLAIFVAIGCGVIIASAADVLVNGIFGSAFSPMSPVLMLVTIAGVGLFVETQLASLLVFHGIVRPQLKVSLWSTTAAVLAWVVVIPRAGALGAAAVAALVQTARVGAFWSILARVSGWSLPVGRAAALVACGILSVLLAKAAGAAAVPTALTVVTGAGAYAAAAWLAGAVTHADLRNVFRPQGVVHA